MRSSRCAAPSHRACRLGLGVGVGVGVGKLTLALALTLTLTPTLTLTLQLTARFAAVAAAGLPNGAPGRAYHLGHGAQPSALTAPSAARSSSW